MNLYYFYSATYKVDRMIVAFLSSFDLPFSLGAFLIGLAVGVALDYLWRKLGIGKHEGRFEVFEHYHWGLLSLILMKTLLNLSAFFTSFLGIGAFFIFAEIVQEHPFALKSSHQLSSTMIGAILCVFLAITWISY
jgi:hypothetical protein